ncbi:MAG: DUF3089 domain-containing protein [Bacteroidales bacterium]|nr:DUF3089 domain-containing protein [Lentimicrobiaceae bacterium]MDD5695170.1 DUF3089 domain-containing protein [Bacteroidales bacterium]
MAVSITIIIIFIAIITFLIFNPRINIRILLLLIKPHKNFSAEKVPMAPDYTDLRNWASHPWKKCVTDLVPPGSGLRDDQAQARVDLFYIHRTTLVSRFNWNADTRNLKMNLMTDKWAIRNQAGIFNESCRIFAPRYRQATLFSFFDRKGNGKMALDLAYEDVRNAFSEYLKNFNNERPLVIAGHSQGVEHASRLIHEFFDGQNLAQKLIVAYLPGMPLQRDVFRNFPPGSFPLQTHCFASWSTFGHGIKPNYFVEGYKSAVCTNPFTWNCMEDYAGFEKHEGGISPGLKKIYKNCIAVKCEKGVLWIWNRKPFTFWPLPLKNYVLMDFDLFFMNIRRNVRERIDAYFTDHKLQSSLSNKVHE